MYTFQLNKCSNCSNQSILYLLIQKLLQGSLTYLCLHWRPQEAESLNLPRVETWFCWRCSSCGETCSSWRPPGSLRLTESRSAPAPKYIFVHLRITNNLEHFGNKQTLAYISSKACKGKNLPPHPTLPEWVDSFSIDGTIICN